MPRVAVVTGGTRGLGRAIATGLLAEGHKVAAVYRGNEEAAQAFLDDTGIPVYGWDVADYAACADGLARIERDLGAVDILINNAGITRDAMLHRMSEAQWWEVIRTNLGSMFNMCRQAVGGMRERGFGRIVNISSINGQKGQLGQANYAASKAGVIGFTKSLALESARKGITVNAVAPGYCETEMVGAVAPEVLRGIVEAIPVARLGLPEEIARVVAMLVREDAGFITGATIDINGGQRMG